MDNERFDALSRVLGENTTRRGAMGAFGVLAGLLGAGTIEAKSTRKRGNKGHRVSADAIAQAAVSPCSQMCSLLFLFDRRAQAVCRQNCDCFRRCLGVRDAPASEFKSAQRLAARPQSVETCLLTILTRPEACAQRELT